MLPEFLAGSHQRYKNDTNAFTTWLSKTAIASGFKISVLNVPKSVPIHDSALSRAERLIAKAERKAKKEEAKKNAAAANERVEEGIPPTVKHLVSTQDLLRQAEAVARNAKAKVPDTIVRVIERAIRARKRCASWFQKTGQEKENTERHLHFVGILERALKILKPDYVPQNTNSQVHSDANLSPKPGVKASNVGLDLSGMSNRFSNLEVEDTEDIVDTAITLESLSTDQTLTAQSSTEKPTASVDVFELDYDTDFDRLFDVFCFFEDLHRIQDFLNETWSKFKQGELDLITASITTNLAFELVRKEEQELTRDILKSEKLDYEKLASIVFYLDSLSSHPNRGSPNNLHITPFDNFIFLSTARSVQKFAQFLAMKVEYPQPVPPARASYIFNPEMLELPEIKRMEKEDEFITQYLMDMTLHSRLNALPNLQKRGYEWTGKHYQTEESPCDDELGRGYERMRVRGEVSTWMIFACRILIDIQEIFGEEYIKHGWMLLQVDCYFKKVLPLHSCEGSYEGPGFHGAESLAVLKQIRSNCERYGRDTVQQMKSWWLSNPDRPRASMGHRSLAEALAANPQMEVEGVKLVMMNNNHRPGSSVALNYQSTAAAINNHPQLQGPINAGNLEAIAEHPQLQGLVNVKSLLGEVDAETWEKFQKANVQPIEPSDEKSFIYARNPIFCGLKRFEMTLLLEHAGTMLENYHNTIFATAHLYNAAMQAGLLDQPWPQMEHFIEAHMGIVFAGKLPETREEFRSRHMLQMGVSPALTAKSARTKQPTSLAQRMRPGKAKGLQIPNTKATDIFRGYFAKTKSLEKCLFELQALMENEKSKALTKKSKSYRAQQLTSLQLLSNVQSYLPAQVKQMKLDKMSLATACFEVLKEILEGLEELDQEEGKCSCNRSSPTSEPGNRDQRLIMLPFEVFEEEAEIHHFSEEHSKKETKTGGPMPAGPKLQLVAKAIRNELLRIANVGNGAERDLEEDSEDEDGVENEEE